MPLSRPYYLIFVAILQALHFFTNAAAHEIDARIEISSEKPSIARVSGRFNDSKTHRNLSFTRSFAGFSGLGERIRDLKLTAGGKAVEYQFAVTGEYVSDAPFTDWSYSIDLTPLRDPVAAAHVSWIANDQGVLMLGDILPLTNGADAQTSAKVKIVLPQGWRQMENGVDGIVETADMRSEVVVVGKDLKFGITNVGGTAITIGMAGQWLFTSDDITSFAQVIYGKTQGVFRAPAAKNVFINVFKFPQNLSPGQWQADTRGQNITIISSDMNFQTQSLQRLHEQLRHEVFHLWIPNGVNLSGNYDWFYEGFALYSSLKLAVAQNQIRFEDFLDTLSRAYAIDTRQSNRMSLIEAAANRAQGAETYLYARGMLTAFLCDVLMLNSSKAKRSVSDLVREVYAKHRFPAARTDGTAAVLAIMNTHPELSEVIDKYVRGNGPFQIQNELALAGLQHSNGLQILTKLNGRQKDLLDALGYNNWRRLS
jgi:hypothetical protein